MDFVTRKMMEECTAEYSRRASTGKITTAVCFDTKKLSEWIQKASPYCSQIQVRFGIYNGAENVKKKSLTTAKSNTGRVTVFFVACDENGDPAEDEDGEDIPIVNQGELLP